MTLNETFLFALLVIFTVPWAIWRLLGGTITLPLVVVQIVVGILLGPGIMGQVLPSVYQAVFLPEVITILNGLALWSVMLFVFVAGLELDLTEAWVKRGETAVTSGLALIVRQGVGRLIRDPDDRGLLVLCDPRLRARPYGKRILASLPDIPRTEDRREAMDWLHAIRPQAAAVE